jgi:hypothetical protein
MRRFSGSVSVISYGKPNPLISKRKRGLPKVLNFGMPRAACLITAISENCRPARCKGLAESVSHRRQPVRRINISYDRWPHKAHPQVAHAIRRQTGAGNAARLSGRSRTARATLLRRLTNGQAAIARCAKAEHRAGDGGFLYPGRNNDGHSMSAVTEKMISAAALLAAFAYFGAVISGFMH